jgi:hypothetical protein
MALGLPVRMPVTRCLADFINDSLAGWTRADGQVLRPRLTGRRRVQGLTPAPPAMRLGHLRLLALVGAPQRAAVANTESAARP